MSRSCFLANAIARSKYSGVAIAEEGLFGIAQEHELGLGEHVCRGRLEVGHPVVGLVHRHPVRLAADEDAAGVIDGVADARDQRVLVDVHEGREDVRDAFLAADECEHLGRWVDFDVEAALEPLGARLAVRHRARVARVLVVLRVLDRLGHRIDDALRGGHVGIADAERDDVDALGLLRLLLAVDLCEQVRRQVLDALGGPHWAFSPYVLKRVVAALWARRA